MQFHHPGSWGKRVATLQVSLSYRIGQSQKYQQHTSAIFPLHIVWSAVACSFPGQRELLCPEDGKGSGSGNCRNLTSESLAFLHFLLELFPNLSCYPSVSGKVELTECHTNVNILSSNTYPEKKGRLFVECGKYCDMQYAFRRQEEALCEHL